MTALTRIRGAFSRCLTLLLSLVTVSGQTGVTNSWTKPTSGDWEDASAWSLGILPDSSQSVLLTNAGWKAVQLTRATAENFPGSLTIGALTVDSPADTANTLMMNYVGVSSPLTVDHVVLNSNSTMLLLSSALDVGTYLDVNGTFNQGEFSGVTARVLAMGNGSSATYNLSNGTLTVLGPEIVGISGFPTVFNQEGGYHYVASMELPAWGVYNLRGGQLGSPAAFKIHGTVNQTGGDLAAAMGLNLLGTYRLSDGSFHGTLTVGESGQGVQTGGSNFCTLTVGSGNYTLSNGIFICPSDLTVGPRAVFEQQGTTNTINGTLVVQSDTSRPFAPVRGRFTLNQGVVSADNILVSGVFAQGGGTNQVAGDLTITGVPYSRCELTGGWLATANTYMGRGGSGNIVQTGGRHQVSGTLRVSGGSVPAYDLNGGELIAPTIEITEGQFYHRAGTVDNTGLLRLNYGGWYEFAGSQQFGQLQLGGTNDGSGSIWFGTARVVLRFADSSGQAWDAGAILSLRNWSGSLNGGGNHQVIFGNNSAGLAPAQVAQIRFDYPNAHYTAKILPTGEVVPNPDGLPFVPNGLTAQGVSANQINLAWTDNSLDESGFSIERSPNGSNFAQIATVAANTTHYSDSGLATMTAYFYRIRAFNGNGDSTYTAIAEASTKWSGSPPLSGMVAWWPAENSADDIIGNHNGTTPYGIAYAPGESGQAFDFDGSNRRVFVPDSPDFALTSAFTVEGWFKARQTSGLIAMRGDDRGGMDAWTVIMSDSGELAFQLDEDLESVVRIQTPVPTGQWRHFAATFDRASASMKLYLNGVIAIQTNTALQPLGVYPPGWNPGIGIGNISGTINHVSFDGLIDDLALYSRALSPAEIESIFNAGAAGKAGLAGVASLSLQPQSGGVMRLTLVGVPGQTYEVEISTNLVNWIAWIQLDSAGTNSVVDANTIGAPQRFYRARPLP